MRPFIAWTGGLWLAILCVCGGGAAGEALRAAAPAASAAQASGAAEDPPASAAEDPVAGTLGMITDHPYGGAEASSGAVFAGPGTTSGQTVLSIGGFEVASGAADSIAGFGVGSADEVQVNASGFEAESASPGVRINLLEKRGTNEWRGSARGLWSGGGLASRRRIESMLPPEQALYENAAEGNRLRGSDAYGLEAGGPLRAERVWVWGALDRDAARWSAFGGQRTADWRRRAVGKLDAQPGASNSLTLAWNQGGEGARGAGAGPDRAPETTLERDAHGDVWRLEDTDVLGPRGYWSAMLGRADSRLTERPRGFPAGWPGGSELRIDAAGVAHGGWFAHGSQRRLAGAAAQADAFLSGGGLTHEIKLGGDGRGETAELSLTPPGRGLVLTSGEVFSLPAGSAVAQAWREGRVASRLGRISLWAQDRVGRDRLTAVIGLRYERQTLAPRAGSVDASPFSPLLPAVQFSGHGGGSGRLAWPSVSPRLGATWALGARRQTLLHATLARYAAQLDARLAARLDPAGPASAYYFFADPRHDLTPPASDAAARFWVPVGFDPARPGATPNALASRLRPELTDEAAVGIEVAVRPTATLSLTATYRRVSRILEERLLVRDESSGQVRVAERGDWRYAGAVTGALGSSRYHAPFFDLVPGLTPTGGTLLTNGDREQRYAALTLGWSKRLQGRWMSRAHLTWQDWTWRIGPDYRRFADPTPIVGEGQRDGAPVAERSGGFGAWPLYLNSRWSFDASALVQLPWSVNFALQLDGRQGFPVPYFQQVARQNAGPVLVQTTDRLDEFRYDNLFTLDARLDRELAVSRDLSLTLSLVGLNLLDAGTVLRREANLGVGRARFVDEVLAPRVLRVGLTVAFR